MLFGVRWWLDRQWYVGPSGGSVAIFQGIPLTILGFDLGHPVEVHEDVPANEVRELETTYPDFDDGIPVEDRRGRGEALIAQMAQDVQPSSQREAERPRTPRETARERRRRTPDAAAEPGSCCCSSRSSCRSRAYAMVGLGLRGRVPRDIVVYGLTLGGAYLLAWGAVRWAAPRADPVLLPIAGMLGGLGLAMIYRLLPADVADEQALWLLIGLAAFVLTLVLVRDDRVSSTATRTRSGCSA